MIVLQLFGMLASQLIGAMIGDGIVLGVGALLRVPLRMMDWAAGFWLFLISPAYREMELAAYNAAQGAERRLLALRAAAAVVCGLGIPLLLALM